MSDDLSAQPQAGELAALYEVSQELSRHTLELDHILRLAVERAAQFADVDSASLFFYDGENRTLVGKVGYGLLQDVVPGMRMPLSSSDTAQEAIRTHHAVAVPDRARDERIPRGLVERFGFKASLTVPILLRGHPIGLLFLDDSRRARPFSNQQVRLATGLAAQAAIAIENARLFEAEHERAFQLTEALKRQKELDRLQAQFIQNVSHELRTPLAIIRGYAEMLDSGELGGLTKEQREAVDVIARRSHSLVELVEDIAAILEVEARGIERSPLNLAKVTQQALADFQTWADERHITLRGEIRTDVPPAVGEARQLRKVLDNLISNALKFTPEGGTVIVRLDREEGGVRLEVSDTGIGIPPEKLDRIFQRFFQLDGSLRRRHSGTGLGLALVKEIIEAHDGKVVVETEPGRGSTFAVWLPTSEQQAYD